MKIVPVEQVRHPLRPGQKPASESPKTVPGREIVTQRDAVMFRATAEISGMGVGATAPFLAQRLAQLWPTPPLTNPALASAAYTKPAVEAMRYSLTSLALVA
ncbi:MAG: hypothetical protein V3R85_11240 [Alphaproteobacteria bacterium]